MSQLIQTIIDKARSFTGTPYQWGGNTAQGMDCSGLMVAAFQSAGLHIPRIAGDQAKIGSEIELDELIPGDLVFFTDKPGNTEITHVGLVSLVDLAKRKISFIHASSSQGVMESELFSNYWQGVFLKATRPKAFIS